MTNKGFTLIELSIVLIIIGLLAGGIIASRDLIAASEIKATIKELQAYESAVFLFKDQYKAIPGDYRNATRIWGAAHPTPSVCRDTVSIGKETCNGNGDSRIQFYLADMNETTRSWQHLANAGLVQGYFTGVGGPNGQWESVPGVNTPETPRNGGCTLLDYQDPMTGSTEWFDGEYGILFRHPCNTPLYTPEEVQNIDSKLDDGKPAVGKVRAFKGDGNWFPNCTTDGTVDSAYEVANSEPACDFIYVIGK